MQSFILSTLLALHSLTASAAPHGCPTEKPPVCIIGAGPAGLSAAGRLEDKDIKAVIFDEQAEVGGKCQAWYDNEGIFHPLGAAFFSNESYPETLKFLNETNVTSEPFFLSGARESYRYDYVSGAIDITPPTPLTFASALRSEIPRYTTLWNERFAPISAVNYKLGVPDEFTVSGTQWFRQNNFTALPIVLVNPVALYGYGDINIVPALYILQYFTPDILTAFIGAHEVYYMDFHKMFVEWTKSQLCKTEIHSSAQVYGVDRSGKNAIVKYTKPGNKTCEQSCSSVIFAFPPNIDNLKRAGVDLDELEHDLFSYVTTHQYSSAAVEFDLPFGVSYIANSTSRTVPPPNDGQAMAVLRLDERSNISVAWSWGPYEYQSEEDARRILIESMSKINKDPRNATESPEPVTNEDVKAFMKWDYMPHFDSQPLREGAYNILNILQGNKNSYWASGLSGMEIVEWAIRGGQDVVDCYF
ncbi:FAD/NAD(P)-binding domain-containing protein [Dothidotthia symphoricarpi CBS 119687]|uniref:FAD/NAD(P)-binding domain-containing protein n=1 Tax=Dothidotthia symphoricarpi CBS 119687 TaxID=1392245 RepID=A0A6A6AKL3_9PLEO|nr:FAD/NAD(P)-binding domain-containing protein [Dothidotthia symphoricarpi CBS 119687]KAF2131454.1 FAD/NAD(P)-binding domain-containing protein [Dothidotthia symphoricarpi CBS 119687]